MQLSRTEQNREEKKGRLHRMEDLAREDTQEMMKFWYEQAVDEQRAELRQYKKKTKLRLSSQR